jgi:hypothetical protein
LCSSTLAVSQAGQRRSDDGLVERTRKSASIKPATANVVPPLADFLDVTISSSLDAGEVSVLRWYIA